ncbi:MAG: AAA family ATPase, partial [Spirochaetota bacterium]|nr:AAA family ATPase [Spirochaetota bacterium]
MTEYHIKDILHVGRHSIVHRAIRKSDQSPVILKSLNIQYPTGKDIARFRREFEITKSLSLKGVVAVNSLYILDDKYMIEMEDFGGDSLDNILSKTSLTLHQTLSLMTRLSGFLGDIHTKGIIHKDINPSNIVWNPKSDSIKVIDFGISTDLSYEEAQALSPGLLEGTLAYISPEQTGRMNRPLDYRTDFYSLGVTLYEMLFAQLPFQTEDPLKMIFCHLAQAPSKEISGEQKIPDILWKIIQKLMAKEAKDRYQSGYALQNDLSKCLKAIEKGKDIPDFSIAQKDYSGKLYISQKLYDRQTEQEKLTSSYKRVSEGYSGMTLVSGYSGMGKTVLVRSIHPLMTENRGFYISGKFEQFKANLPYHAFITSFDGLLRHILMESEVELKVWREKLLEALGANSSVITALIPSLRLILGDQPPAVELEPSEARNRFHYIFQKFISVFASSEHPLTLFLDDLQWVDPASLGLLKHIFTYPYIPHLYVIGSFRDNEVGESHPLSLTLNDIRKDMREKESRTFINEIFLRNMSSEGVSQLLADTLNLNVNDLSDLVSLVLSKTNGNPFFLNQLLREIFEKKLLWLDKKSWNWCWDLDGIRDLGYSDNVVDLMTGQIHRLSDKSRALLCLASCVGGEFDLETLSVIQSKPAHELIRDLREILISGLILPLGDSYKYVTETGNTNSPRVFFKFLHDRVQQAAYDSMARKDRVRTHYTIGKLLLKD